MTELSVYILTVLYKCHDHSGKRARELEEILPRHFTCTYTKLDISRECTKLLKRKLLRFRYDRKKNPWRIYYITGSGQHVILAYIERLRDIIMS